MPSKFGIYLGVLLPPAQDDWLTAQAKARGVYRSKVVRELIQREMQATEPGPEDESCQSGAPYQSDNPLTAEGFREGRAC